MRVFSDFSTTYLCGLSQNPSIAKADLNTALRNVTKLKGLQTILLQVDGAIVFVHMVVKSFSSIRRLKTEGFE
jgi:hypothetical protein